MTDDDIKRKLAYTTTECDIMLEEALVFMKKKSPKQAEIMLEKFRIIKNLLETFPEIGTIYKNGLRKFPLGKFRYFIYYREKEDIIEIVGIWHTSRGTEFVEPAET
jgi:plasmid stabilization system protein ParE